MHPRRQPRPTQLETEQAARIRDLEWLVASQERQLVTLRDAAAEPYPAELHAALLAADAVVSVDPQAVPLRILARAVRSATQARRRAERSKRDWLRALRGRLAAAFDPARVDEILKGMGG